MQMKLISFMCQFLVLCVIKNRNSQHAQDMCQAGMRAYIGYAWGMHNLFIGFVQNMPFQSIFLGSLIRQITTCKFRSAQQVQQGMAMAIPIILLNGIFQQNFEFLKLVQQLQSNQVIIDRYSRYWILYGNLSFYVVRPSKLWLDHLKFQIWVVVFVMKGNNMGKGVVFVMSGKNTGGGGCFVMRGKKRQRGGGMEGVVFDMLF